MRLDHIAYRVANRDETVEHLVKMFGYSIGTEFTINFDDGTSAECIAMVPLEKNNKVSDVLDIPWTCNSPGVNKPIVYHMAPEIFVSEGTPDSIVDRWVKERGGIGGVHHMAYSTDDIEGVVDEWKRKDVEFLTENIIDCPDDDLRQIFTKPQDLLGGVIIELIERGEQGFCQNSVKELMEATEGETFPGEYYVRQFNR
jgi:hypothetical protein